MQEDEGDGQNEEGEGCYTNLRWEVVIAPKADRRKAPTRHHPTPCPYASMIVSLIANWYKIDVDKFECMYNDGVTR